jgi:hypothetical protein
MGRGIPLLILNVIAWQKLAEEQILAEQLKTFC